MANFLDEIKALLMGAQKPQAPPDQGFNADRPWDSQMFQAPPPRPAATPPPLRQDAPLDPDDPFVQADKLIRQRELAKRFLPQELWNK